MSNPTQKSGSGYGRRKRTTYRKKDYKTRQIARAEAKKVISRVVESKNFDSIQDAPFTFDSSTGMVLSLVDGLNRGDGVFEYSGDSITPTHLRIRGIILGNDTTNVVRLCVIQFKKIGGVPTLGTLFAAPAVTGSYFMSAYNTNYNESYNVLYDEFFSMVSGVTGPITDCSQLSVDIRIPMKKLRKIHFSDAGSVTAGNIYIIACSDSASAGHPSIRYYSRLYFKDA